MTHHFDPDGSIHEYRREMERREMRRTYVFALASCVVIVLILAAFDVVLSLYQ